MAKRATKRITKTAIDALAPNSEIWDAAVAGFGARRRAGPVVSYVLMARTKAGKQLRLTIGKHGSPWTVDAARDEARRLLVEIGNGADPAADKRARREALTVSELCDDYMAVVEAGKILPGTKRAKKVSTVATDRSRIESHIRPLLGSKKVEALTRGDVQTFMEAVSEGKTAKRTKGGKHILSNVRGGQGAAARTVGLLGAILAYAVERRMRPDNPVRGLVRPADGKRERRLTDAEYQALGNGLRKATADRMWPAAVGVARFLALTGWRLGEALGLRWAEVDLVRRTATLSDSKTGKSMRPLSHAACRVLSELGRSGELVFPSAKTGKVMAGYRSSWDRIAALGELPNDITPHVMRHSLASIAADRGYSELTIAGLIGHRAGSITSKYVHHADAVLLAAADAVADEISRRMGEEKPAGTVVELKRA